MSEPPQLQFAHVLFIDVVGYSTLDNPLQLAVLQELQRVVRAQPEYERAGAADDLLSLPTGDGMALVFFREPVSPLRCAVQISRALRHRRDLPLRMGIHSGPVYRVEDLNANQNVSGGGINTAQRVMDCGEAGHILVSEAVARLVEQLGEWPLEDLGEYQAKHGRPVRVFNIHGADFGNAARPARRPAPDAPRRRIAFLYRRGAQPDEELLEALARHFAGAGCEVFWDRQLKVGMKWAEEMRRRIFGADAVVVLVSPASARSETLPEELQVAREAQGLQGSPRLLPVRIGDPGPLPEAVSDVLGGIEHAAWESAADTARVARELEEGLSAPAEAPAARSAPASPASPLPWLSDAQYGEILRRLHEALTAREKIRFGGALYWYDPVRGEYVMRAR